MRSGFLGMGDYESLKIYFMFFCLVNVIFFILVGFFLFCDVIFDRLRNLFIFLDF